jgi:hypothetical protein
MLLILLDAGAITNRSRSGCGVGRGGGRLTHERGDELRQAVGLVLGRERAGILYPLQARVRQVGGQPFRVRRLEEAIVARPGDQGRAVELLQAVRRRALVRQRLERLGEEGARWLADLPSVVEELERRWSLVTGEPLADGSAAYLARVRTADGRDAVLRIGVPGGRRRGRWPSWWAGSGRSWAGPAQRRSPTRRSGSPSAGWRRSTWSDASSSTATPTRPTRSRCRRHGRARSLASCSLTRTASWPTPPTTSAWCSGWCPELLAGDATALAARYCRQLAVETGLDAAAIWEWGFLERVSSGLFILSLGAEEMARPFLQTAELLV